jgi:hypothetical protein
MICKIWKAIKARKKYIGIHLITIILFFSLFFALDALYSTIIHKSIDRKSQILSQAINNEKDKVFAGVKNVANSETLSKYIRENNFSSLLSFLNDQKEKNGLQGLLVTDKNGVVLLRVHANNSGDYLFNTTTLGRYVANDRDMVSIVQAKNFPLVISAGVRILYNGKMIGAVFGGLQLDDDYAQKLQKQYLSKKVQIAFYSGKNGLTGTTFKDKKVRNFFETYSGAGNNWLSLENHGRSSIINGEYYFIKTISFYNLDYPEDTVGGAVIFIPRLYTVRMLILSMIIVFLFLIIAFLLHRRYYRGQTEKKIVFSIGATIIAFLLLIVIIIFGQYYYSIQKNNILNFSPSHLIYNSVLQFYPDSDFFNINYDQNIRVRLSTGGEQINMVKVKINFDSTMIKVKNVLTDESLCPAEFFFEKGIDNEKGEVNITCGVPSPGFKGENGTVAELLIQPIHAGEVVLKFNPETQILANDGLGTNVLRMAPNADYRIFSSSDNIQNLAMRIIPFSPTHPNSEQWYNKNLVRFSWLGQEGITYKYELNKNLSSILTKPKTIKNNFVSITVPDDGVYYFHLAAAKDGVIGPISTYQLRIDITPPTSSIIRASSLNIRAGEMVRFSFDSSDSTSGLQANYYVKIDNGIFMPSLSQLFLLFLKEGVHIVTVRVFDNANNYSDAKVNVIVKK